TVSSLLPAVYLSSPSSPPPPPDKGSRPTSGLPPRPTASRSIPLGHFDRGRWRTPTLWAQWEPAVRAGQHGKDRGQRGGGSAAPCRQRSADRSLRDRAASERHRARRPGALWEGRPHPEPTLLCRGH